MFHPDLRLLRSFAAVAEELSVTRAAERVHLSQPTVSGQIKELEQSLGFALFHRTTRSIALTARGGRILSMAQAVISQADALRAEVETMQQEQSTHFRLGAALFTYDFVDRRELLDAFSLEAPHIRFTIDNRMQHAQVVDLFSEKLDASLLLGIAVPPNRNIGAKPDEPGLIVNETQYPDTLERVVLARRRVGLVVPKDSPLAAMPIIPQSALRGQKIALLSNEHGHALTDPIEEFFDACGAITLTPPEANAWAVERYAETHGICATGIDWYPVHSGLVQRNVEGMDFHLDLAVVLGTNANRAARVFLEFAREWQAAREGAGNTLAA